MLVVALLLFLSFSCNKIKRILFYPPSVDMGNTMTVTPGQSFNHSVYGTLLKKNVSREGRVNYQGFKDSENALNHYLELLAKQKIKLLSSHEQLAFLINAYNACTIKLILTHTNVKSIRDIEAGKRWKLKFVRLSTGVFSLNEVEHELIRRKFAEPRVHFALVCASKSCPPLRNEEYRGEKLNAQLDDQARRFLSKKNNAFYSETAKTLYLNAIFDWYRGDFTTSYNGVLNFVENYLPGGIKSQVHENNKNIKIEFLDYDWALNGSW